MKTILEYAVTILVFVEIIYGTTCLFIAMKRARDYGKKIDERFPQDSDLEKYRRF